MTKVLTIAAIALCAMSLAWGKEASVKEHDAACERMDFQAIHLAANNKLDEAAKVMDFAIEKCPPDVSRFRSRGVLYAVMGDKASAERLINESIRLSKVQGDECEADLSRGELTVIKGGPRAASRPASCPKKH